MFLFQYYYMTKEKIKRPNEKVKREKVERKRNDFQNPSHPRRKCSSVKCPYHTGI